MWPARLTKLRASLWLPPTLQGRPCLCLTQGLCMSCSFKPEHSPFSPGSPTASLASLYLYQHPSPAISSTLLRFLPATSGRLDHGLFLALDCELWKNTCCACGPLVSSTTPGLQQALRCSLTESVNPGGQGASLHGWWVCLPRNSSSDLPFCSHMCSR